MIPAPCVGRCEQAPAVVVHQHALARATLDQVVEAVQAGRTQAGPQPGRAPAIDLAAYTAEGGYRLLRDCVEGHAG